MISNDDAGSDDAMLSKSELLTAEEIIRRRHRHIIQLSRVYRDHYWALMADLRRKYRDYLWTFGGSSFVADAEKNPKQEFNHCAHPNCRKKAIPTAIFCRSHILSDSNQVLYKACAHLTSKGGSKAPTICAKPLLRSATPSYCTNHLQRAEKSVARSLKKAGLSTNDSNRIAPMFHIIGAEFVHEILRKRTLKESKSNTENMK
uniref:KAT8 regulatory NSL complex subunit 2 n=1 Tax=Kalanchoe fedtschenkoi TaxID=63787 RepID=A0A7N0TS94_KALFE